MLIKSIEKKDPGERDERDEVFLELAKTSCDWTDRAFIDPILKECKTA